MVMAVDKKIHSLLEGEVKNVGLHRTVVLAETEAVEMARENHPGGTCCASLVDHPLGPPISICSLAVVPPAIWETEVR